PHGETAGLAAELPPLRIVPPVEPNSRASEAERLADAAKIEALVCARLPRESHSNSRVMGAARLLTDGPMDDLGSDSQMARDFRIMERAQAKAAGAFRKGRDAGIRPAPRLEGSDAADSSGHAGS